MLEQPALLLCPWNPVAGGERIRLIHDAATQAPLGLARERESNLPGFLRWLWPPVVAVYETEDESLLSTMSRCWGLTKRWQVWDADAHLVGRVRRVGRGVAAQIYLFDRRGDVVAAGSGRDARFLAPGGMELGRLEIDQAALRLTFAAGPQNDPFVRMLLLAAAITSS